MSAIILAFTDSMAAAGRLGTSLDLPVHQVAVRHFPDNEALVRIPTSAHTVILYRSLNDPDHKLIELLLAASAARDGGAQRVILIAPYLAYMRQDKAFHPGEAVSQKVIGGLLSSHFDALLTVDPHLHRVATLSQAIPGIPAISLSAAPLLTALIDAKDNPIIIGPDSESRQWTEAIAQPLGFETLIATKQRLGDRQVSLTIPEVERAKGRRVIIVDDMISSGRTLAEAAKLLRQAGATSIEAIATHCLARPDDLAFMAAHGIARIASSDSIDGPTSKAALAPLIAHALRDDGLV
ncbi:ribose-phosphate diphosphokinase [Sphingobium chlorophenolicum]|uniref:Putative ribose-phosphate pyrophosphokinase n=1 Tax=Sphingobium chlorophenolicum TaxID=46429 RepID=A0A081RCH1_SPHCR|nr:ribose-phosphate diphosphokinase [Sphingobium chlorophenolicum]KEQ52894.1 putative ribose-phosphate pyrophosphokinase [Sphingobium chlorophenolicum]